MLHDLEDFHTCHYHRTTNCPSCATQRDKIYVHRINNTLEIKWYLYIQDLKQLEFGIMRYSRGYMSTFDPTNRAIAVPTLSFVPRSSYVGNQTLAERPCSMSTLP